MPFQKGQSGNPGGRKKVPVTVRDLIASKSARMVQILEELAEHAVDERVRASCAKTLLEWGIGKPATLDPNGEVVRDEIIQVVVPDFKPKDKP